MHDVERSRFMMTFLFCFHVIELIRQSQHSFVHIQVAMLLILDALLRENSRHNFHGFIGTPVHVQNFILVLCKFILGAADYAEVRRRTFSQTDWDFHLNEALVVAGILHLLQHNALFHLTHIFLLNNAH